MSEHVLSQTTAPAHGYDLPVEPDGTSWAVRENLQAILVRELVGPAGGPDELLVAEAPTAKYITGKLAPEPLQGTAQDEGAPNDEGRGVAARGADDDDDGNNDGHDAAQRRGLMAPSSMGLRFQVPCDLDAFTVHCSWGRYQPQKTTRTKRDGTEAEVDAYRREQVEHSVEVPLLSLSPNRTAEFEVEGSVVLRVDAYEDDAYANGAGRCLVDVALCNDGCPVGKVPVGDWLFQAGLAVDAGGRAVFLPVHDWVADPASFARERDPEQRRLNLQYRNRLEYAVGRTCSVTWEVAPGARAATRVATTWAPTYETPQVNPQPVPGAVLNMRELACADGPALEAGLRPVVQAYAAWLDGQERACNDLPAELQPTAREAVTEARQVLDQLSAGLDYLVGSPSAVRCFNFMNAVMAEQRVHVQAAALRTANPGLSLDEVCAQVCKGDYPHHWRVFQLAFVLMQVEALSEPTTPRRSSNALAKAQLLFFPTGGGKTEAYLGLAAYAFAARRLQGERGGLSSDGVTVLMRYTLRLLTSQQFQRAAAMVCAAELERQKDPGLWGSEPFRLGLWVGSSVTPKSVEGVAAQKSSEHGTGRIAAQQLHTCPWCGSPLTARDLDVDTDAGRVYQHCSDETGACPFADRAHGGEGLPVLITDEEIYRLVPSFVIATVDKFARLAREGEASSLFGYVGRKCDRHGYVPRLDAAGASDYAGCTVKDGSCHPPKGRLPKAYVRPTGRLRPPDLIIQDELHLVTGSLGTTVGLFEVAVDALCTWEDSDGSTVRPLVVASSATVRNAADQIKNLYGRGTTLFPPQVLDASDTFFSKEQPVDREHPGRRYVGLSTPGTRLTAAEIRTASALMTGAQTLFDRCGEAKAADPYMTLVGYFSTTRELAGMARYMQDDVTTAVKGVSLETGLSRRYGANYGRLNVGELTSRINSDKIVDTLNSMAVTFDPAFDSAQGRQRRMAASKVKRPLPAREGEPPFDAVLATSMLQVGVDVPRLGLMMVVGQPKNTAEYIQASSRVGRDTDHPGLVVTLDNWARPRDLAHYEQFQAYHESFYARVEPLSVTPFSETSLARGAAGLLVSAARVRWANEDGGGFAPESAAARAGYAYGSDQGLRQLSQLVDEVLVPRIELAAGQKAAEFARGQLANRLDTWHDAADRAAAEGKALVYEKASGDGKRALIRSAESADHNEPPGTQLDVANSMREVQPEINVLMSPDPRRQGFWLGNEPAWESQPTADDPDAEPAEEEQADV